MIETFTCSCCGLEYPMTDCCEVGDRTFCPDCLEEETVVCDCCGERILSRDNAGDDEEPLCQHCYETHYTTCDCCGALIRLDDAYYLDSDSETSYCYVCYCRKTREASIHDYSYKPEPLFYGDGTRFFGLELEIDGGGEYNSSAKELLAISNKEQELIYCKHDGSLNDGFEIVTHPMTLSFHQDTMPWQELLQKARRLGYTSHQSGTCGLHLHVSRSALGESVVQQEEVIARILYFFEKNWEELLKFSRRTPRQLERWAARYGYKEHPQEILDHVKKNFSGRYTCVNLCNTDTVEFRMFRGTLKYNTLIATLQMVNRICDVAFYLSDDELKALSWTSFVSDIPQKEYPELVTYLKERRLYVNDEIITEEEI